MTAFFLNQKNFFVLAAAGILFLAGCTQPPDGNQPLSEEQCRQLGGHVSSLNTLEVKNPDGCQNGFRFAGSVSTGQICCIPAALPADLDTCTTNADCAFVESKCCPCSAGGIQNTINKKYVPVWNQQRQSQCPNQALACPQVFNCIAQNAVCQNQKCQLWTSPEPPPDPCDQLDETACRQNPNCAGVYAPSCPTCGDYGFRFCHAKTG